mmetsp:Transcript_20678/g.61737  ORF Transcript_20678/g.61737 Transcript_20678/m.61737 type:complete len:212 (-) Transcript_20678:86-721(-)
MQEILARVACACTGAELSIARTGAIPRVPIAITTIGRPASTADATLLAGLNMDAKPRPITCDTSMSAPGPYSASMRSWSLPWRLATISMMDASRYAESRLLSYGLDAMLYSCVGCTLLPPPDSSGVRTPTVWPGTVKEAIHLSVSSTPCTFLPYSRSTWSATDTCRSRTLPSRFAESFWMTVAGVQRTLSRSWRTDAMTLGPNFVSFGSSS